MQVHNVSALARCDMTVQRISAITLRVSDTARSVEFYADVLGLEVLYGGKDSFFSSLRTAGAQDVVLNLEASLAYQDWGRIIFHVADVDEAGGSTLSRALFPRAHSNISTTLLAAVLWRRMHRQPMWHCQAHRSDRKA
jgi:catechol 2,3-dioxygenase-like lactoylglutathione lyase family enzyme